MIFSRFVLSAAFVTPLNLGAIGPLQASVVLNPSEMPLLIAQQEGSSTADEKGFERPTLSLGNDGPLVVELQLRLQAIGIYEGSISGGFDEATKVALESFQKEYGLGVTGTANSETWQALSSPATAKLEAALKAEDAGKSAPAEPDADVNDSDAAVLLDAVGVDSGRSPRALAIFAVALTGLGLGGVGVWKAVRPSRKQQSRRSKSRKRPPQKLSAAAPPLLTAANTATDDSLATDAPITSSSSSAHDGTVSVTRDSVKVPQKLEDHVASYPEAIGRATAQFMDDAHTDELDTTPLEHPLNLEHHPNDEPVTGRSLVRPKRLPAPPPPPSAIQHSGEPTPLTPTTRLIRQDVVETLVAQLQSTDPTQRRKAVWELGQRGDSRAIQPLVNLIAVSDSKQRSLILGALSEIGSQTLKPMKRALAMSLQDGNAEVRKNAIRDLTRIYDLVAQISNLLAIATEDEDPEVRDTARWALGQLNRIRSNAGLEQASNQQLLQNSVSPPETLSEEFQFDSRSRETELN